MQFIIHASLFSSIGFDVIAFDYSSSLPGGGFRLDPFRLEDSGQRNILNGKVLFIITYSFAKISKAHA